MPLVRTLRFWDLTMLIIGTVIGSGIFLIPSTVLRDVNGRTDFAFAAWIAGGILSLLGALCYGELTASNPDTGGLYVHIYEAFGRLPAFLYGWTLFFMISSGSIAALAVAFGAYAGKILPINGWQAKVLAVGMIICLALLNVRGTRHGANFQNVATVLKVLGLLSLAVAVLYFGGTRSQPNPLLASAKGSWSGFGLALIGVLWAYEGWQYCSFSAGETIEPQRTFPRALLVSSVALIFLYVLANSAYLVALGPARAAQSDGIAAAAVAAVFGRQAGKLVSLAILVSIVGAANGLTMTSPRVYYAMAKSGIFFRNFAGIHSRFQTPATAILASSCWAAALAMSGTFDQLLQSVVFSAWIFYGLGAAAVFVYRRNPSYQARSYSVPGYPVTPAIFVLAALALLVNAVVTSPLNGVAALLLAATGTPAFLYWRSRSGSSLGKDKSVLSAAKTSGSSG